MMYAKERHLLNVLGMAVVLALSVRSAIAADNTQPGLAPLPQSKPVNAEMAELGKFLFFDSRMSGDWGVSCASCHDPAKGWGDGAALSRGYPSMEYFRNAPTLINARHKVRFMWDGRLDGSDLATLVRDQITETPFMNMDGRLAQERIKQVPEYDSMWKKAFNNTSDPYGPRMFNVIGEFLKTIESKNVPLDKYLNGDASAISPQAQSGLALFKGKANCIACHNGAMASDGKMHRLGVPENPEVLKNPLRTITMLRHYSSNGMPNYMNARTDMGSYAITKQPEDIGKFATPSLRELKYTAPYMHNGMFKTLDEVVDFYNRGGGKESKLKPLGLSAEEKRALLAFLETLSGDPVTVKDPGQPDMQVRTFGTN